MRLYLVLKLYFKFNVKVEYILKIIEVHLVLVILKTLKIK